MRPLGGILHCNRVGRGKAAGTDRGAVVDTECSPRDSGPPPRNPIFQNPVPRGPRRPSAPNQNLVYVLLLGDYAIRAEPSVQQTASIPTENS